MYSKIFVWVSFMLISLYILIGATKKGSYSLNTTRCPSTSASSSFSDGFNSLTAKGYHCQCPPVGMEKCDDDCTSNDDCTGRKICCFVKCRRICKSPRRRRCNENEEYIECGTACPQTCLKSSEYGCFGECVHGCFCKRGYIRNEEHICIRPMNCPNRNKTRCLKHEHYMDCGPACTPTCGNMHPSCSESCTSGCFCMNNYVRNSFGFCVPPNWCIESNKFLTKCLPNETYKECGSAYQRTCNEPIIFPKNNFSDKFLCVAGCFCKDGYLRNEKGVCILPQHCPNSTIVFSCRQFEKYVHCGSPCPPTCRKRGPRMCTEMCARGCFCDHGYLRNDDGNCVSINEC